MTTGINPEKETANPILETKDLCKYFTIKSGGKKATLKAVDRANLKIYPGKTLGLVGESGSGKSTIAFTMVQLHEPTSGEIIYEGGQMAHANGRALKEFREHVQMIFQDPYSSLDPRQKLKTIIERPLKLHTKLKSAQRLEKILEILNQVGLDSGQLYRYPHEFSGGQRQRISIARALVLKPRFLVLDEPTSSIDMSVQTQIINLLKDLQRKYDLAYLFISHDLRVVRAMSHDILVMKDGRIVEQGLPENIFDHPENPYTVSLIKAAFDLESQEGTLKGS